jgi:hypothetical protein
MSAGWGVASKMQSAQRAPASKSPSEWPARMACTFGSSRLDHMLQRMSSGTSGAKLLTCLRNRQLAVAHLLEHKDLAGAFALSRGAAASSARSSAWCWQRFLWSECGGGRSHPTSTEVDCVLSYTSAASYVLIERDLIGEGEFLPLSPFLFYKPFLTN